MKRVSKNFLTIAIATTLLVGAGGMPVNAKTSDSHKVGNARVYVYISKNDSSVTGTTAINVAGGWCTVKTSAYYWFGKKYYRSDASRGDGYAGAISATAKKKLGGADVVGGKAVHKGTYQGKSWNPTTTIGKIPSGNVIMK